MVEDGILRDKENSAKLLDVNSMLKKESYKVQVVLGLSKRAWKMAYAILDTRARPNIIKLDAMDPS